jgi:hypothetical protein
MQPRPCGFQTLQAYELGASVLRAAIERGELEASKLGDFPPLAGHRHARGARSLDRVPRIKRPSRDTRHPQIRRAT